MDDSVESIQLVVGFYTIDVTPYKLLATHSLLPDGLAGIIDGQFNERQGRLWSLWWRSNHAAGRHADANNNNRCFQHVPWLFSDQTLQKPEILG